jgi:hypothetical protein
MKEGKKEGKKERKKERKKEERESIEIEVVKAAGLLQSNQSFCTLQERWYQKVKKKQRVKTKCS